MNASSRFGLQKQTDWKGEALFYGQLIDAAYSPKQRIVQICQLGHQYLSSRFGYLWVTDAPGLNERSIQHNVNFTYLLSFEEFGDFTVDYLVEVFFAYSFGESA